MKWWSRWVQLMIKFTIIAEIVNNSLKCCRLHCSTRTYNNFDKNSLESSLLYDEHRWLIKSPIFLNAVSSILVRSLLSCGVTCLVCTIWNKWPLVFSNYNTSQSLSSIVTVANKVGDETIVLLGWCFWVSIFKRNLYWNAFMIEKTHCDFKIRIHS